MFVFFGHVITLDMAMKNHRLRGKSSVSNRQPGYQVKRPEGLLRCFLNGMALSEKPGYPEKTSVDHGKNQHFVPRKIVIWGYNSTNVLDTWTTIDAIYNAVPPQ